MSTGAVQHEESYNSPIIIVVLAIIILAFFFLGFFSIYFCRCFMHNLLYTWVIRHSPSTTPVGPGGGPSPNRLGLDPKIIDTFPTFIYSSVKGYRREKYGLECAICLVEFTDEDMLRLLPSCCHVFHQECVDLWLEKHTTCPVCRRNLDAASLASPRKSPLSHTSMDNNNTRFFNESESPEGSYSITIKDENEEERGGGSERGSRSHFGNVSGVDEDQDVKVEKFSRSHSTGHSIGKHTREEDRFTLRLPDDVKEMIFKRHTPSKSCTTF